MKCLTIAVNGDSYFSESVITLIDELGHNVYLYGKRTASLMTLANDLQIEWADSVPIKKFDIYVTNLKEEVDPSLAYDTNIALSIVSPNHLQHYVLTWVQVECDGYRTLDITYLNLEKMINGADIYDALLFDAIQMFSTVLLSYAQDTEEVSYKPCAKIATHDQVNLQKIRIWHQSNQTQVDYPSHDSLYKAFKYSANRYAARTAIVFEKNTLIYDQLYNLSQQVIGFIRSKMGSMCHDKPFVVAIALHKSFELYAVILGVLGAGCTYVPIDPEYPKARIETILENANPDVLITKTHLAIDVNDDRCMLIDVDQLKLDPNLVRCSEHFEIKDPDQRAVIIYTSGSTGTPKGIVLSHQNIFHFSEWYRHHVHLNERSKALQFTTISFDASLLDIFPTLLVGAELVVPNGDQRHHFDQLNDLIVSHHVSHSFIPPAMLSALPDYHWPSMSNITTGGDICDADTIARWSKNRSLHNIYGPTECTVLATTERFIDQSPNKIIGKPISNTKVYILDETLNPAKTNRHGELYISGNGVGMGYYGCQKITDNPFTHDHFSDNPTQNMYRTGDIGYWDESGKIHFVGRKDHQLKIRGFRVELGEIENAILSAELFRRCVVIADTDKKILGFVSQPINQASIHQLEKLLANKLPDYMFPYHIRVLEHFPATANGKIDRSKLLALPMPKDVSTHQEVLSNTESQLRTIWSDILDIDECDILKQASFFKLGGHSLLVSMMLLAVKNQFSGSFTLARFMENPTIEGLSSLLTNTNLQKGDQISDRVYSDMVLDSSIKPLKLVNDSVFSPSAVLLTGANGFLGVHLIEELLSMTDAVIYCLIRAESKEQAWKKLHDACRIYNVTLTNYARLNMQACDLSQPCFGVSQQTFFLLAETVDIIYHNGALVNHVYDYDYLYSTNVRSTIDLLRLAVTGKNKQFVYISTLSAASNISAEGKLIEDGPSDALPAFVNNGYNLTKWVSEQLVWQAYHRGLPVTIVRPGNMCGHSQTGHCLPDKNRILLLLKGSAQLGYAPNWDVNFDLCPVDFIAKGTVACTTNKTGHIPVLHFHNPMPLKWSQYVSRLSHHNVAIELTSPQIWRNKLLNLDENNALFNVVSFYLDDKNEDIGDISHIDHHITLKRLKQFNLSYPEKNHQFIDTNLGFLVNSGFIQQKALSKKKNQDRPLMAFT